MCRGVIPALVTWSDFISPETWQPSACLRCCSSDNKQLRSAATRVGASASPCRWRAKTACAAAVPPTLVDHPATGAATISK